MAADSVKVWGIGSACVHSHSLLRLCPDPAFCPADDLVSGVCTAYWALAAYSTGFCIATSIGALLAVFSAYRIAPAARRFAMWSVVALGAILPFYLVQQRFPDWKFLPAVAVAGIAASILTRHASHHTRLENA